MKRKRNVGVCVHNTAVYSLITDVVSDYSQDSLRRAEVVTKNETIVGYAGSGKLAARRTRHGRPWGLCPRALPSRPALHLACLLLEIPSNTTRGGGQAVGG